MYLIAWLDNFVNLCIKINKYFTNSYILLVIVIWLLFNLMSIIKILSTSITPFKKDKLMKNNLWNTFNQKYMLIISMLLIWQMM